MHDKAKVLVGIAIFLVLILFPVWYGALGGGAEAGIREELAPMLEKLEAERGPCVKDRDYMASSHMELLDQWRDELVRENDPWFEMPDGKRREKSLTRTCLDCHAQKEAFCDRCHEQMAVTPYCWDCHLVPPSRPDGE